MVAEQHLSTIVRNIIGIGGSRSLHALRAFSRTARTHFKRRLSAYSPAAALVWSAMRGS